MAAHYLRGPKVIVAFGNTLAISDALRGALAVVLGDAHAALEQAREKGRL